MRTGFAIFFALILLSACVPSQATPQPADPQPAATFTAIPTLTAAPPTPTYAVPPLDDAANTVYYFAPDVCNAKWSNSGEEIPCPGIQGQINAGYVDLLTDVELNLPYKANALLTIPAQAGDFAEIFGTFPARKIELGDFFRTQLYCMSDSQCDVTFSLGYYDSSGKYYEPFPEWPYNYTEHSHLINFPLDTLLNGQTVQLTLVVRDNDNPIGDLAVWVEPRIFRHPGVSTPTP